MKEGLWWDKSWNVVTGCGNEMISESCTHCYARRMAQRLKGRFGYPKDDPFKVTFHPDRLDQPLKWKKPRHIFVVSMGDLFHEDMPYRQIARVFFEALRNVNNHTYLFLTKRPQHMADFIEWYAENRLFGAKPNFLFEFPYIWLGITAENQQRADERIPILLQIPAAKRFVSLEPLLSDIDIEGGFYIRMTTEPNSFWRKRKENKIDWVIVGGESGPGARPMHPDWVRSVRDQCQEAGVPLCS